MKLQSPWQNLVIALHAIPSSAWLETALRTLGRYYRFVSAQEVEQHLDGSLALRRCAHVTFDDGHRSTYDFALPVLQKLQIPATMFVSPTVIAEGRYYWFQRADLIRAAGGDEALRVATGRRLSADPSETLAFSTGALIKLLPIDDILDLLDEVESTLCLPASQRLNVTLEQLREMHASGLFTIGGHTIRHPILANESDASADWEVATSVRDLTALLGAEVRTFAYPNGQAGLDFTAREQGDLRRAGVRLAFSTEQGTLNRHTNPLAIPRLNLNGSPRETPGWIAMKTVAVAVCGLNPEPPEPIERKALLAAGTGRRQLSRSAK